MDLAYCMDALKLHKTRLPALIAMLWLASLAMVCQKAQADVLVVAPKVSESALTLSSTISYELKVDSRVVDTEQFSTEKIEQRDSAVLIGKQALEQWAKSPYATEIPAVAIYVSRKDMEAYKALGLISAIYLEPPLIRQLKLTQFLLGRGVRIGILFGSEADIVKYGLTKARLMAEGVGLYYLKDYDSLNRALVDLLSRNQVLLGAYDPSIYSKDNIKNILITAYRQNRPLVGPSSAYVRAGAMASTYSDKGDVTTRLIEILRVGFKSGHWAKPDYNPYFKVGYNDQVARSLNLVLPDAEAVAKHLRGEK